MIPILAKKTVKLFWKTRWYVWIMVAKIMFTNWRRFLFVSIKAFVEVAASVTNISCIAQVTLKFIYKLHIVGYKQWLAWLLEQFHVLTKCTNKVDCLIKEMLFIRKLKPSLNVQTDSIRAKVLNFITQYWNKRICPSNLPSSARLDGKKQSFLFSWDSKWPPCDKGLFTWRTCDPLLLC